MNKIILTCVSLLFIGCVHSNEAKSTNQYKTVKYSTNGTEGDGHTETFNNKTYCNILKLPTSQYIKCRKNHTLQYASLEPLRLNKSSQDVKRKTIHITTGTQKLILLADVWQVSLPLKTTNTRITTRPSDKIDYKIIEINIADIKNNKIVIMDNNSQILMIVTIVH